MTTAFLPLLLCILPVWISLTAHAQIPCPRLPDGSDFVQPYSLYASNGYLQVDLTYESRLDDKGLPLFCFMMLDRVNQSPTLFVNPGDTILMTVTNNYPGIGNETTDDTINDKIVNKVACGAKRMTSSSVNIHFHGIHGAPLCHEDEVVETLINYKDTFTYQIKVPLDQQPGMYWYHPHVHGLSEAALQGGSAGAIIVRGIVNEHKGLAGLPEQIMVFRDHSVTDDVVALYTNINGSIYDLSLNYITITLPESIPPVLRIHPSEKQLWRIVNAGADAILLLKLQYDGVTVPFDVVAVDGDIVLHMNEITEFLMPPGKRVQIVVTGPSLDVQRAVLTTQYVWTGNDGDLDPTRDLLLLIPDVNAAKSEFILPANLTELEDDLTNEKYEIEMVNDLLSAPVTQTRTLFFFELPDNETFYITEEGKENIKYDRSVAPAITAYSGTVEKWVIQNRAQERKYNYFYFIFVITF
jgi:FtsP/CotA-like multicopper oxidase with cupredoxin domain